MISVIIMKPQDTQRTLLLKGTHGRGVGDEVRDGRAEASYSTYGHINSVGLH